MKRQVRYGVVVAALVIVAILVGIIVIPRRNDVVTIYGDGTIKLNSQPVTTDDLAKRSFKRPVLIRTFEDTSPMVMHRVIDALAQAKADADFEGGKFQGQRPDLNK